MTYLTSCIKLHAASLLRVVASIGVAIAATAVLAAPNGSDVTCGWNHTSSIAKENVVFSCGFTPNEFLSWTNKTYQAKMQLGTVLGVTALRVIGTGAENAWEIMSPKIMIGEGKSFRLRLKTAGDVDYSRPEGYFGSYESCICWLDASGVSIGDRTGVRWGASTNVWRDSVLEGAIPRGAKMARIRLGADFPNAPTNGLLAIASVSLSVLQEDPSSANRLQDADPPVLERISPSPTDDLKAPVRFRLSDESGVDWSRFACTLDGMDITRSIQRDGNTFEFSGQWKSNSLHRFTVRAADLRGNFSTNLIAYVYFGERMKSGLVTLRDDGVALIDGKPFFPIGVYAVCKRKFNGFNYDTAMKGLKAAGVNLVHTYDTKRDSSFEEFLDAADKYGMKVMVRTELRGTPDESWRAIATERKRKSMFSWYIGDDTHCNTSIVELKRRNDLCKAVDNARLTMQADMPGPAFFGHYAEYAPFADGLLMETYPVWNVKPNGSEVPVMIRDMKTAYTDLENARCAPRAIWSIVQYFQGWKRKRFPTLEEMRAMAYLSVIHGARGVTWYTYGGTDEKKNYGVTHTPETWSQFCRVAKELSSIHDDLVTRDDPLGPKRAKIIDGATEDMLMFPSVTCLLKKGNGAPLLLAANSSTETVKAMFDLPDCLGAEVLFEDRTISACGALIDEFLPYAVHVYRLRLRQNGDLARSRN